MILVNFILKTYELIKKFMSGDNMLGEQPLKFYSKEVTETKIELVNRLMILKKKKNSIIDLDRKHRGLRDILPS